MTGLYRPGCGNIAKASLTIVLNGNTFFHTTIVSEKTGEVKKDTRIPIVNNLCNKTSAYAHMPYSQKTVPFFKRYPQAKR
jgi:hypothetical protein